MTNGDAHPAERHPPTANGTATDPSKQKAPQQPGPQPDEPKPQKQTPTLQPSPSANSSDSKAANGPLQAHANGGPPQPAPVAADVPITAEWTEESQRLLVNALKEIGKQVPDRCAQSTAYSSFSSMSVALLLAEIKPNGWCTERNHASLYNCRHCHKYMLATLYRVSLVQHDAWCCKQ